jgi:uncharacterized protein (DUF1697 family)
MTVYILLFRGVGGATQLPTAPLRAALTQAGFHRVATYINSGNAVVATTLKREKVIAHVAEICRREFKFDKDIHALTLAEWRKLIANNPLADAVTPGNLLHAAVLAKKPAADAVKTIEAVAIQGERIAVIGKVAYLHLPFGSGRSKMAAKFDKGIGVANTARNWNTVLKLREIAQAAADK